MAKISAKGAVITLDGTNVSTYAESYEIQWDVETLDVSGFGDGWQNYVPGQKVVGFTINFNHDMTTLLPKLISLMATPAVCSIKPDPTGGGQTVSGTFFCAGVPVSGSSTGGAIKNSSVKFMASGTAVATFA